MTLTLVFPENTRRERVLAWLLRVLEYCPFAPEVSISAPTPEEIVGMH